jgi:hypothetical protein
VNQKQSYLEKALVYFKQSMSHILLQMLLLMLLFFISVAIILESFVIIMQITRSNFLCPVDCLFPHFAVHGKNLNKEPIGSEYSKLHSILDDQIGFATNEKKINE